MLSQGLDDIGDLGDPFRGVPIGTEVASFHAIPMVGMKAAEVAALFGAEVVYGVPAFEEGQAWPFADRAIRQNQDPKDVPGHLFDFPPGIEDMGALADRNVLLVRGEPSAVKRILDLARRIDEATRRVAVSIERKRTW